MIFTYDEKEFIAHKWMVNGDHPLDQTEWIPFEDNPDGRYAQAQFKSEGKVVCRFRNPEIHPCMVCPDCTMEMDNHGWIEDSEQIVCPGDYIARGVDDKFYAIPSKVMDRMATCSDIR